MENKFRENTGVLYENKNKKEEGHPDLAGSVDIYGVQHWLSGWIKSNDKGEFIKIAFREKSQLHEPELTEEERDKANKALKFLSRFTER